MPKGKPGVRVQVERGEGKIQVAVEAEEKMFLLSDLLAKEGVFPPLEKVLREKTGKAVTEYVDSARAFLRGKKERVKVEREKRE